MQDRSEDEAAGSVAGEDEAHGEAAVAVEEGRGEGHYGEVEEAAAEAVEEGLGEEEVPELEKESEKRRSAVEAKRVSYCVWWVYLGRIACEEDPCAHQECASQCDELRIVHSRDQRIDEYAATPGKPASKCSHQSLLNTSIMLVMT